MKSRNDKKLIIVALILLILTFSILTVIELVNIENNEIITDVSDIIEGNIEKEVVETTSEEYDQMINKCEESVYDWYIQSSNVSTSVDIDEDTYIDSSKKKQKKKKNKKEKKENYSDEFNIVDLVYCNDLIMVNFLSKDGTAKSLTAVLERIDNTENISVDNTEIIKNTETSDVNEINEATEATEAYEVGSTTNKITVLDSSMNHTLDKFNEYNSNEILRAIGDIITAIVKSDKQSISSINTEEYFTDAGYKDLLESINSDTNINNSDISFMKFGKSSLDMTYYDRIIAQVVVNDTVRDIYTNIIIKLDDTGKIFDIDIL